MYREPAIQAVYRHLSEDLIELVFLDNQIDVPEKVKAYKQTNLKRPFQKPPKRQDSKGLQIGPEMSVFVTDARLLRDFTGVTDISRQKPGCMERG